MSADKYMIDSLGEYSLANIPGANSVHISYDTRVRHAHMMITLSIDSWAARESAIDKMIEIQGMFDDEMSISYSFGEFEQRARPSQASEPIQELTFA